MKIILISIGTRGDIEPFLAIGELLIQEGHEVICSFPAQFQPNAESINARFVPLSHQFLELLESEDGKMAMGGKGSIFKKIKALMTLYKKGNQINKVMLEQQHQLIATEKPDRVIHSLKVTYSMVWGVQHPGKSILVSPIPFLIHPVASRPTIGFNGNFGSFFNKLTYSLSNFGLVQNVVSTTKAYRKAAGISGKQIRQSLFSKKLIFTVSPSIYEKDPSWPENVDVLGYHEKSHSSNWEPSSGLLQFFEKHPKVLLLTFGSMTNPEPGKKTRVFLDLLDKHQIPALINIAAGGLIEPDQYNQELVHFVKSIPYDWVLPKIYAVVHHGGSGTTHLALKYGCASMIMPHILDQFAWRDLIVSKGVGPKGMAVSKINSKKLEPLLLDLWNNQTYKNVAEKMENQMKKEEFKEQIVEAILKD